MNDAFKAWLSSHECYAVLKLCAVQVIKRSERLSLQLDDAYLDRNDYLEAVTNQLWDFMKDRAGKIAQKATSLLVSGDEDAFMAYLSQEFIDFCLDKRREVSPFHAYYRHVRSVLSEEDIVRFESKVRIPMKSATYSDASRPGIPMKSATP